MGRKENQFHFVPGMGGLVPTMAGVVPTMGGIVPTMGGVAPTMGGIVPTMEGQCEMFMVIKETFVLGSRPLTGPEREEAGSTLLFDYAHDPSQLAVRCVVPPLPCAAPSTPSTLCSTQYP